MKKSFGLFHRSHESKQVYIELSESVQFCVCVELRLLEMASMCTHTCPKQASPNYLEEQCYNNFHKYYIGILLVLILYEPNANITLLFILNNLQYEYIPTTINLQFLVWLNCPCCQTGNN